MRLLALTLLPLLAGCIEEKTDDDDDGSAVDEDCDEHDATAHPGGTEVCNDGIRNDCDGSGRACSLDLGDADLALRGASALDEAGMGLTTMADIDGDDLDEVVIGARSADDAANDSGTVYAVRAPRRRTPPARSRWAMPTSC